MGKYIAWHVAGSGCCGVVGVRSGCSKWVFPNQAVMAGGCWKGVPETFLTYLKLPVLWTEAAVELHTSGKVV